MEPSAQRGRDADDNESGNRRDDMKEKKRNLAENEIICKKCGSTLVRNDDPKSVYYGLYFCATCHFEDY